MNEIVPLGRSETLQSTVPSSLESIRESWRAKGLIDRVRRLLPTDPSSACQRLFNAAIHDLREKVVIAGVDIAKEAATLHKLPPINGPADIEEYSTAKLITLAHKIGLLGRADCRRLERCYEIRRDLEHEDDEYEASSADCIYIFTTSIEVVLSRDPIHLVRVADVKTLIEVPQAAVPAPSLMEDFAHAPDTRQVEIVKFLCSIALDATKLDLVRENAFVFLNQLSVSISNPAKLEFAAHLQEKFTRGGANRGIVRIAYGAGILGYINKKHRRDFFNDILKEMIHVGYRWNQFPSHGELLRALQEIGGLRFCPDEERSKIMIWLVRCYIGEEGGQTQYGHVRHVFFSNTAEPFIVELLKDAMPQIGGELEKMLTSKDIERATNTIHLKRRIDNLRDLMNPQ